MQQKHFAIVAGTLTGNRGAEAMVTTCIDQIQQRFPGAVVHVLSYYPDEDTKEAPPHVFVHSATPLRLVCDWLPMAVLAKLVPSAKHKTETHGSGLLGLLCADALLDVAGVSFVDGREKFLPFNVLTLLPFLINEVPVFKLSQAIGPISSLPNRIAARLILPRLRFIAARGGKTREHLRAFGVRDAGCMDAPDVAFLLEPTRKVPYAERPERVAVVPSSLVQGQNPDYAAMLARVCDRLIERNVEVVLVVHSYRSGSQHPRNNDLPVAEEVRRLARHADKLRILGEGLDARQIKTELGGCRAVLTSRFHGMIAALGTVTPVVVVGWSHKYREVLEVFGLADACFDYREMQAEALMEKTLETLAHGPTISEQIATKLPEVQAQARSQFDRLFAELS